mmetsp:Transcript_6299/g.9598  ORF Transcript_6299/g.9598 Transcript_6299/m.9598 type:complete len:875 (+) Transcript_6299:104-2728(+)
MMRSRVWSFLLLVLLNTSTAFLPKIYHSTIPRWSFGIANENGLQGLQVLQSTSGSNEATTSTDQDRGQHQFNRGNNNSYQGRNGANYRRGPGQGGNRFNRQNGQRRPDGSWGQGGPRQQRNVRTQNGPRPPQGDGNRPVPLLLKNPLKLRQVRPPPRETEFTPRGNRNDRREGEEQGRRPRDRPAGPPGSGIAPAIIAAAAVVPGKTDRRKEKKKNTRRGDDDEEREKRTSLRLTTTTRRRGVNRSGRSSLKKKDRSQERAEKEERAMERRRVNLTGGPMTVGELAEAMDEKPAAVVKFLMTDLGVMAAISQSVDPATCEAVAKGFGKIVVGSDEDDEGDEDEEEDGIDEDSALATGFVIDEDDPDDLIPRPPVVTIMGHVDHGKTSLLDAIRDTHVTAGEAGGITQHIGAYQAKHDGDKITFIDTPGHAAFTDMRQRGANITDIVILVVAADDGVKQQTADSIACARQAGVPVVVAVNKMDLATADPARVKGELTEYDVLTEDLGGDVLCSEISAKKGTNLDDLLSKVMLQAELEDLRANPNREAQGTVVEARVERGLGTVATTLVQKGTLKIGDAFVAGETYGRVRALISTDGKKRVKKVGPSTPIRVVGFDGIPAAGDIMVVVDDDQVARELAENRQRISRERSSASYQDGLMQSVVASFAGGLGSKERREMCVVIKADVQGSAEALTRAMNELKLENDEAIVTVKVLVSEAGEVTKSDVAIASVTPGTTIIAFGTAANFAAQEDARSLGVPIEYFSIVYDAIESVESRMQEVLSPTPEGEYIGSAVVQEIFSIGKLGDIAGSRCQDGYLKKGSNVRVMRGDKILKESRVKSLRSFKSEVEQIEEGNDCGVGLVDFEEFVPGDIIECYAET